MLNNIKSNVLIDIRTVSVNKDLPQKERIIEYVRQIVDPYHFKYKDFDVTARYSESGPKFEECLKQLTA